MTNAPVHDGDEKLTKRDEEHLRTLEHFADSLARDNLLYGSALDGMESGLNASAAALDATDLDATMAVAEGDIMKAAAEVLEGDVRDIEQLEAEVAADDDEEDALLAGDDAGPEEQAA